MVPLWYCRVVESYSYRVILESIVLIYMHMCMYWVLALTRAALPKLVPFCVPTGFCQVFVDFVIFLMVYDVLKVCVPAVFGEG